ncbi:MAG TPA: YetF domain-containing protein [Segetibacter sp.]|nr:YetF domain-containing protein [Segetibacter sp.]
MHIFFGGWESLLRTFVITVLAYVLLIVLLRGSGKRTLSKMNAFDFIVTIALGSTLATVMLNKSIPLADGILAFFLLIYLQYIITYLSVRSTFINRLIKSSPSLIFYKGEMIKKAMQAERITEDEVLAIIREKGFSTTENIDAVVLETDGSLTVIKSVEDFSDGSLKTLKSDGE